LVGLLTGALVAGLAGSPHCVAMCGGFAGACADRAPGAAAYHAGRLVTYAVLGALAGALGSAVPGPGWVLTVLAGTWTTWFALSLAGLVHAPALKIPGLSRLASAALGRGGLLGRVGFGAATALLPCGLVYTALGVPAGLASPALGALAMVLFGLGTVPLLAGASLGVRRVVASSLWARRVLAALVLASGWWSLGVRQGLLAPSHPVEDGRPACH
jgi:sulfite exporter TauE/SafE